MPGQITSFKLVRAMRDRIYFFVFLLGAGLLLYLGRDLLERSAAVTWGLTFGGTTAAGVFGVALYRVQLELRASRRELARKEAELSFAREVQEALFPKQFPADGGLEFLGICVPASGISGDYYDVMKLDDGRLIFALGDISGKGISAAILMSNLHAVLRTLARAGYSPADVCDRLNRHLHDVTDGSRFATFFYAEWHRAQYELRYINAGHTVPILVGSCQDCRLEPGGPPLGLFLDFEFRVGTVALERGDLIALYSDGVTEAGAHRGEEFGESRLKEIVTASSHQPLAEIQRQVLTAARRWSRHEAEDDMTLLLVRATDSAKEGV